MSKNQNPEKGTKPKTEKIFWFFGFGFGFLTIKKLTEPTSQAYIIQEEAFAKTHLLRPKCSEMAALTMMDVLMTTLRGATDAEMLAFMQLLNDRGIPLFNAGEEARAPAPAPEPKAKEEAKKEPKVEEEPMPVAVDGAAPEASAYRIAAVDPTTCVGRVIDGCDKRWSPHILREKQCGKKMVDGCDLCKRCAVHEAKYAETGKKTGQWTGRVTEEPLEWVHMLGTAWAEKAKPKFNASAASAASVASDAASDSGASEEMEVVEKKVAPKAKKVTAEEKEAKKAETAAAAAAKKEAKKAETAAAAAAKKEAAAAAKPKKEVKPKKEKEVKEVKEVKKSEKKPEKSEPKVAAASAAVVEVEFELEDIGGTVYAVINGNVYDYDGDTEKRGAFVGRRVGDEDDASIDTDGAEVL